MKRPPSSIPDLEHLDDLLSEPTDAVVEAMGRLQGDLIILGVGGKMGPTLARMARRASEQARVRRRVIGVSRFAADANLRQQLANHGIETIACDLLGADYLARLPEVPNVIAMTGMKFGSTGQEAMTWAMNSLLPARICEKFRRSRIVMFSTGNVYGLCPVHLAGSVEADPLRPVGDYAMSTLGRERLAEYCSRTWDIPLALLRLNYANELRYGVLVDLAQRVLAGQPIDVSMGYLNAVWQADANAMTLCAFDHASNPPFVVNLAGPELLSVRRVAQQFGALFNRPVTITGTEASDAFISNGQLGHRLFGYPRVPVAQMITWIADWLQRGGATLGKPTHFEARDGLY
jgi:nucleoside-diphosphate-sugar epimerase